MRTELPLYKLYTALSLYKMFGIKKESVLIECNMPESALYLSLAKVNKV